MKSRFIFHSRWRRKAKSIPITAAIYFPAACGTDCAQHCSLNHQHGWHGHRGGEPGLKMLSFLWHCLVCPDCCTCCLFSVFLQFIALQWALGGGGGAGDISGMWLARRLLWDPLFLGYRGAIGRERAVGVVGNSGAAWLCLAGCRDPAGCRSTTTFPWGPQVNSLMWWGAVCCWQRGRASLLCAFSWHTPAGRRDTECRHTSMSFKV